MNSKRKLNVRKSFFFIVCVLLVSTICFFILTKVFSGVGKIFSKSELYIASENTKVPLYDTDLNEVETISRGSKVIISKDKEKINDKDYYKVSYNKNEYYILVDNLVKDEKKVVREKKMYVRTPVTFYESNESVKIKGLINKGDEIEILDYDNLKNGVVNMYKVKHKDQVGFVYGKYLVNNHEESLKHYDEEGLYKTHASRLNTLKGGSGANLDYYPNEKVEFENNKMPKEVRSLYLNSAAIRNVEQYIELAKKSNINAFVVDIKDNTTPAYPAKAMSEYSKTNYDKAFNSYDTYKNNIKKLIDNGFYVIGRITVFKDSYYIKDNPSSAILNTSGTPFEHNGSFWPSAFQRDVWEFNVSLAVESVKDFGFHEIQFDYVRFPDRTGSLEDAKEINLNNPYNEEKAQAIQRFIMYACDELHKAEAYVSVDVFGESAHNYVTAYGQYWPAISNVVDAISAMPYPDHFSKYEYGFKEVVWTVPYKLLNFWGGYVVKRQAEIKTPAVVRTWIQAYDTSKAPKTAYDSYMVSEQIRGLYDAGLTGGYITWNSSSSMTKYTELAPAFGKEY